MFRARNTKKFFLLISVSFFILGMISTGFFLVGLKYTNQTEFCLSCHSMQINLTELKDSLHWSNASGIHAGCADCHVPKPFFHLMKAKIMAAKLVWHEILGTIDSPEKYEAKRWEMANIVWEKMKSSDSRECKICHSFEHMDLSEQNRSARNKHEKADDQGKTCIDCHKGIVHEEPTPPSEK